MVMDYLQSVLGGGVESEVRFNWPGLANRRYDIVLPTLNAILEVDGEQHFQQIKHWGDLRNTHEVDMKKMTAAYEHGFVVIRLVQVDVWLKRCRWQEAVDAVLVSLKEHTARGVIFIGGKEARRLYQPHVTELESLDIPFTFIE